MNHLANAAALTQAQERLHELGVPHMSATDKVEEEWVEAEKSFADLEAELDAQPLHATKKPKHFRVSNNKNQRPSKGGHSGFTEKFVEHGCYSIDVWDSQNKGYNNRMQQHRGVEVGDILWLSESQKNDRVYRGVVKTPFRQSSIDNPNFFARDDVLGMVGLKSHPDTEHPHWQDSDPARRKAWLDKRCEYICQVEWSGPVEMNKSALNEGFIGKTIAARNEKHGLALDREFFSAGDEIPPVSVTCIEPNARIKCNAPDDSKYRRKYAFSIGDAEAERDCWHWWRDPMDGIIRILGGNAKTNKATIYRVEVKGNSHLSFEKKNENQSKALELYNKYGRK